MPRPPRGGRANRGSRGGDPAAARGGDPAAVNRKKTRTKTQKNPSKKKVYEYTTANNGLPIYGVLAVWKTKKHGKHYSQKQLLDSFQPKLADFMLRMASLKEEAPTNVQVAAAGSSKEPAAEGHKQIGDLPAEGKKPALKRKQFPYLRRLGPSRAIVTFGDMRHANEFAKFNEPGFHFRLSIPMRFVSTMGMFEHSRVEFQESDIVLPQSYEVLGCESKNVPDGKMQVFIAVRGSVLPNSVTFKGHATNLELAKRKATLCMKCLRFGHTTENCMRLVRCGYCEKLQPSSGHTEKRCPNKNASTNRCIHCGKEHATGDAGCDELNRQHKYKMNLVRHSMDYLTMVEKMYLKMVRNTKPNSAYQKPTPSQVPEPPKEENA